jgi:hypothetical protein
MMASRSLTQAEQKETQTHASSVQLKNERAAQILDTRPNQTIQRRLQNSANGSQAAMQMRLIQAKIAVNSLISEDVSQGKFEAVQRVDEEEPLQGKFEAEQRVEEEEEPLQGKFEAVQRVDEEEPLQGRFEAVQRVDEEEPLQGKFEAVQRVEKEEPLQGKFEAVQRVDEEEPLQGRFEAVQRVDEEEPLQGKFEAVQRVEEEELLQGKFGTAQLHGEPGTRSTDMGLPNQLKVGIESLSGMSMDHVKVHYNSAQPKQLNAHAYAQGNDIHVAPGQERHLPHEAWHVVQQAQGRVKPTMQMKTGVPVNDDVGLEIEADVMGAKALIQGAGLFAASKEPTIAGDLTDSVPQSQIAAQPNAVQTIKNDRIQFEKITQFVLTQQDLEEWVSRPDSEYDWMEDDEKEQMGIYKAEKMKGAKQQEEWKAALDSRVKGSKCVSWDYAGKNYHINLGLGVYHITEEASPKIHYFFEGFGEALSDKPSGNGGKHDKLFSALPSAVQTFIKKNFSDLLL